MTAAPHLFLGEPGSCIVCLRGTDTALGFLGEAEWVIAGLVVLGVPADEAWVVIADDAGTVPCGTVTRYLQVCAACVETSPFPAPQLVLPGFEVPGIVQPGVSDDRP